MRDHKINGIKIEVIKNSKKNKSSKKIKGFGTQILGFGSGGAAAQPYDIQYLVIAGGASGGSKFHGGGGGAGGYRHSTLSAVEPGTVLTVTVGAGGAGGASGGNGGPGGSIDKPNGAASQGGRGQSPSRKGYGTNQPGGFGGDNGFGIIFRTQAVADASDGNTNTPGPQGGDNVNSGIV